MLLSSLLLSVVLYAYEYVQEARIVRSEDDEYTDDKSDDNIVGPQETTRLFDGVSQPEVNSTIGPQETTRLVDDVFEPPAVNSIVALQKTARYLTTFSDLRKVVSMCNRE